MVNSSETTEHDYPERTELDDLKDKLRQRTQLMWVAFLASAVMFGIMLKVLVEAGPPG